MLLIVWRGLCARPPSSPLSQTVFLSGSCNSRLLHFIGLVNGILGMSPHSQESFLLDRLAAARREGSSQYELNPL